jgi:hypothetical protein
MNRFARRVLIGGVSGAISTSFLASALPGRTIALGLGLVLGAAFALGMLPAREGYVDRLMSGAAMGISLWGLITVIGIPLLSGTMPEWGAAQMRTHLPSLVGWIMYGASVSILIQGCDALVTKVFGAEKEITLPVKKARHVLILGGGFGGMKTAEQLEEELRGDPSVAITLVSDTNALLFTPMLAEVAGGNLEPNHISKPLRGSLHRTAVVRGVVEEINLELRVVKVAGRGVAYDQLVLSSLPSGRFAIKGASVLCSIAAASGMLASIEIYHTGLPKLNPVIVSARYGRTHILMRTGKVLGHSGIYSELRAVTRPRCSPDDLRTHGFPGRLTNKMALRYPQLIRPGQGIRTALPTCAGLKGLQMLLSLEKVEMSCWQRASVSPGQSDLRSSGTPTCSGRNVATLNSMRD